MVPACLVVSAIAVWGGETGIPVFSRTYDRYVELTRDPNAGRDQWLEVIRSFVAVQQKGSAHTKSKSLFLAGKASLTLYGREGRIEDLDSAIRYFNEVKRITRHNSRLVALLRELKTAHQLRRTHTADLRNGSQPSTLPPVAPMKHKGRIAKPLASTIGVSSQDARQGWWNPANAASTGKMPVPPDATKRQNSSVASDMRNTPHSARLSDVYQGNPFCPVNPTEPFHSVPPVKPVSVSDHEVLHGREPSSHSLPPVGAVSVPRPVEPDVAPDPPRRKDDKRPFVVVIDPGHGGKDPGAVSSDGNLKEKDITLYVSRRLKKRLEERIPGIKVELTRTDDSFLTVTQRTATANSFNADLFISIHCNSYPDSSAEGIETYYLSKAGSERAMRVAARENDIPLSKMSDLEATLLDLMMTSKKSESEKLAETVHEGLARSASGRSSAGRDRGVKRGPFYVLLGATMPAILVECGYISNMGDRRKLGNKRYLDSIARGISSGAHTYLKGLGSAGF